MNTRKSWDYFGIKTLSYLPFNDSTEKIPKESALKIKKIMLTK